MTEQEMRFEARLLALEYLWASTYNMICKIIKADESIISLAEVANAEAVEANPVRGFDPAMSDMLSDEIAQSMERLWLIAREMQEAHQSSKSP